MIKIEITDLQSLDADSLLDTAEYLIRMARTKKPDISAAIVRSFEPEFNLNSVKVNTEKEFKDNEFTIEPEVDLSNSKYEIPKEDTSTVTSPDILSTKTPPPPKPPKARKAVKAPEPAVTIVSQSEVTEQTTALEPEQPTNVDFQTIMFKITEICKNKKDAHQEILALLKSFDIPSIPVIPTRPDLFESIYSALEAIGG